MSSYTSDVGGSSTLILNNFNYVFLIHRKIIISYFAGKKYLNSGHIISWIVT